MKTDNSELKVSELDHLSFSSLTNFENCEYNGFMKALGLTEKVTTQSMEEGLLFHKIIELQKDTLVDEFMDSEEAQSKYFGKRGGMLTGFKMAIYNGLSAVDYLKDKLIDFDKDETETKFQELTLQSEIGGINFEGRIDCLNIFEDHIDIYDWKYIKDFKKSYNEKEHQYEEWFESYLDQQLLYAYLVYSQFNEYKDRPIHCHIMGFTKQYPCAMTSIDFNFDSLDDLTSTSKWEILSSRIRYARIKLNKAMKEFDDSELKHCGLCQVCRENKKYLSNFVEIG